MWNHYFWKIWQTMVFFEIEIASRLDLRLILRIFVRALHQTILYFNSRIQILLSKFQICEFYWKVQRFFNKISRIVNSNPIDCLFGYIILEIFVCRINFHMNGSNFVSFFHNTEISFIFQFIKQWFKG